MAKAIEGRGMKQVKQQGDLTSSLLRYDAMGYPDGTSLALSLHDRDIVFNCASGDQRWVIRRKNDDDTRPRRTLQSQRTLSSSDLLPAPTWPRMHAQPSSCPLVFVWCLVDIEAGCRVRSTRYSQRKVERAVSVFEPRGSQSVATRRPLVTTHGSTYKRSGGHYPWAFWPTRTVTDIVFSCQAWTQQSSEISMSSKNKLNDWWWIGGYLGLDKKSEL